MKAIILFLILFIPASAYAGCGIFEGIVSNKPAYVIIEKITAVRVYGDDDFLVYSYSRPSLEFSYENAVKMKEGYDHLYKMVQKCHQRVEE